MTKAEITVKGNRLWFGNYLIMHSSVDGKWCVYRVEPAETLGCYKYLEQAIKYCLEADRNTTKFIDCKSVESVESINGEKGVKRIIAWSTR